MTESWQRRIARARELAVANSPHSELLSFYEAVAVFQAGLYEEFACSSISPQPGSERNPFLLPLDPGIARKFHRFLTMISENAPAILREAAQNHANAGGESHYRFLAHFWQGDGALFQGPDDFLARAYLQPWAVLLRERTEARGESAPFVCSSCRRKPYVGVLRPLGEGGRRSLVCSFCLGEWEFRRLVCAACGEEKPDKLPVYAAEELPHVRVDACESCKCYMKTVDLTKNGLAEPVVDEIASVALDLWAGQRGYAKLQRNLLQL